MWRKCFLLCAAAALGSCAWSERSNWHLVDSGFSISPAAHDQFAVEVHVNQLKQLGGDVNSAEFRRFVLERLQWHDMCPSGWQPLPCVAEGSCVQRTSRSVTVLGSCTAP